MKPQPVSQSVSQVAGDVEPEDGTSGTSESSPVHGGRTEERRIHPPLPKSLWLAVYNRRRPINPAAQEAGK
jgi:hypothetical protein